MIDQKRCALLLKVQMRVKEEVLLIFRIFYRYRTHIYSSSEMLWKCPISKPKRTIQTP